MQSAMMSHVRLAQAARGDGGARPAAGPPVTHGFSVSYGIAFLLVVKFTLSSSSCAVRPVIFLGAADRPASSGYPCHPRTA